MKQLASNIKTWHVSHMHLKMVSNEPVLSGLVEPNFVTNEVRAALYRFRNKKSKFPTFTSVLSFSSVNILSLDTFLKDFLRKVTVTSLWDYDSDVWFLNKPWLEIQMRWKVIKLCNKEASVLACLSWMSSLFRCSLLTFGIISSYRSRSSIWVLINREKTGLFGQPKISDTSSIPS